MYEFVCGFMPFCDELNHPLDIYIIIDNDSVFPNSVKDDEFKDLIQKILSKDIKKRVCYSYSILAHSWFSNFEIEKLINMSLKFHIYLSLKTT